MKPLIITAIAALASAAYYPADAHGGGLNAQGCHNDRRNGGYHCHRAQAPTRAPQGLLGPAPRSGGAFANCTAARSAGAAPVRRGQPGYGAHLDRDGDGIGCE